MGKYLLYAQIALLALLFLFSNLFNLFNIPFLLFIFLAGIVVYGLGLYYIGKLSFTPLAKPRKTNVLATKGIYRYVRHPLYVGLILIAISFLFSRFILLPTIIFVLFVWVTDMKINLEEKLLTKKHPKYTKYKRKVKKYIPFIF